MSQCLNPSCNYQNPDPLLMFCQQCGGKLLIGDRYRALRILGQGGFGRTFLGVDQALPSHPQIVIKQFLPADLGSIDKAAELFTQEAIRLDDLGKHPQIPTLFAHLELDARQYLIQEFIDGKDLLHEMQEQGAFSEAKIRLLLADLLPVLQYIHDRQVIHRDIKPENIIRRRVPYDPNNALNTGSKQSGNHVLVDFGAAKFVTNAPTATGTRIGSAIYVAPEQIRGKAIFASDLYSLGVTCIHLLTNVSPFDLMNMDGQWIWRELTQQTISYQLGKVLDRLIMAAPSQRYPNAQAVLQDLQNPSAGSTNPASSASSYQTYKQRSHLAASNKSHAPTKITPIYAASDPAIKAIAPPLMQFTFTCVRLKENQMGNRLIGRFTQNAPQVITKTKSGRTYREALGEVQAPPTDLFMVWLPAGKFAIGSPLSEVGHSSEEIPNPIVQIAPFFMSRFPITQRQWKAVMENNPALFIGNGDRPVENVSWDDAQLFCQKLIEKTGRPYRLPSEAEWEYACRAGTNDAFSFGETITLDLANYRGSDPYLNAPQGNSPNATTSVGGYPANGFGLHDLHGNVWEWCADNWHDDYDLLPKDGSAWTQGGDRSCRVIRGGSWRDPAEYCRSAKRSKNAANQGDRVTGFRVAVTLEMP